MKRANDEGTFLYHTSCDCGSSDGKAVYSSGTAFCFVCQNWFRLTDNEGSERKVKRLGRKALNFLDGEYIDLTQRGITEETCRKYGYKVGVNQQGTPVQIAPYYRDGKLVAQKIRYPDKRFSIIGNGRNMPLFGQHLCNDGGKRIVITEGEIDCLSVSQAFNNSWQVVSLPNGTGSAAQAVLGALEFLDTYQDIVLAFDADEQGQKAAKECAELFSPHKVRIASYPTGYKDANELLQDGKVKEITQAIFNAQPFKPDGLVSGTALWDVVKKPIEAGLSYPFPSLTQATYGIRLGELVALGAGTGMGKTDVFKEIALHLIMVHNQKVGLIFLEEANRDTMLHLMGKSCSKLFHLPDRNYTEEEKAEAFNTVADNIVLYDHFGYIDWDTIKRKIRYMAKAYGCKYIFLDHITALVSGDREGDERKQLDYIMTELASLVRELKINVHFISHLTTPEGKPHEEGGRVMIRHFRGSRAIGQWSSFMFGLERNQQAEDEEERHTSKLRILKDRYTGQSTGIIVPLKYIATTGRITECDVPDDFLKDTPERIQTKEDF